MNEKLTSNVHAYAAERQLRIGSALGAGKDGIVWVCKSSTARVAVKALHFDESYLREKAVYERLQESGINSVLGFKSGSEWQPAGLKEVLAVEPEHFQAGETHARDAKLRHGGSRRTAFDATPAEPRAIYLPG